ASCGLGAAAAGRCAGCWGRGRTCAAAEVSSGSCPTRVRLLFFSTTTDLDRPWLNFCCTWPDSTVRFRLSGLRVPVSTVLSVVSFDSLIPCPFSTSLGRHHLPRVLCPLPICPSDIGSIGQPRSGNGSWHRLRSAQHVPHSTVLRPNSFVRRSFPE